MSSKQIFFLILIEEMLLSPYLYFRNFLFKIGALKHKSRKKMAREVVDSNLVDVVVHEWGGYCPDREKRVRNIKPFRCGLKFQLERFLSYKGENRVNMVVTISDIDRYKEIELLEGCNVRYSAVENIGMDFSGYAHYFHSVENEKEDRFVILTNSSVNSIIEDFLDGYIDYMRSNRDVAMLGISHSTKTFQTLIRNNFRPHIQSFFLLTTRSVLRDIVDLNGGVFPGEGVDHKLLLIRKGELKISELALRLGYSLAVVRENGEVYKFSEETTYRDWDVEHGDVRVVNLYPNKINRIKDN